MTDQPSTPQSLRRLRAQLVVRPLTLLGSVVLFVLLVDNNTFWRIGSDVFSGHPFAFAGMVAALYCLTVAVFSPFALPVFVKPFSIFILILSSVTGYYMDTLGAFIDREMIQNVMVTTVTESKHLITMGFLLHVALYGLLPSAIVFAVRLKPQPKLIALGTPFLAGAICLLLTLGLLATNFKTYASVLRVRKDFLASYQPGAPIVSTFRYAAMMSKTLNVVAAPSEKTPSKASAMPARPSQCSPCLSWAKRRAHRTLDSTATGATRPPSWPNCQS